MFCRELTPLPSTTAFFTHFPDNPGYESPPGMNLLAPFSMYGALSFAEILPKLLFDQEEVVQSSLHWHGVPRLS